MGQCKECNGEILCDGCNNKVVENKEFDANINFLNRKAPYHLGHMLLYYKL